MSLLKSGELSTRFGQASVNVGDDVAYFNRHCRIVCDADVCHGARA